MTRQTYGHGTRACYLRGCRRPECSNAHYRYMSRYRLDDLHGQRRRVDAGPVLQHIHELLSAGWIQSDISRAAGVAHRLVSAVAAGQKSVSANTHRRILAIPVGPPPEPVQYVDATGTVRRLRALFATGHTIVSIAPHIGINPNALAVIARGERPQVRVHTAAAMKRTYHRLSRIPGTSVRSRRIAARRGWHGPLAWDDATIDDPAAQPELDVDEVQLKRDELAAIRRAEVEHLARFGISNGEIKKRVDLSASSIAAIVREIHTGQRRDRGTAAA